MARRSAASAFTLAIIASPRPQVFSPAVERPGAANQCKSGFCVDTVCCDAPCGGQCQACAEPGSVGQCKTVSGAPRGTRPQCSGTAACAGSCDGANPTACTFPGASKTCGTAACTGDVSQPAGSCDSNGGCAIPSTKNCLPYGCDSASGACKITCAGDGDCAQGAKCDTTSAGYMKFRVKPPRDPLLSWISSRAR